MITCCKSMCRKKEDWKLPNTPFSVLLFCDYTAAQDEVIRQCEMLLRAGCAFFDAVGRHHLQWHLAFDEANLRCSPDLYDEKTITIISRETLEFDSVEEWVLTSGHPLVDIEQGIILYEDERQLEIAKNFLCRI